MKKIGYYHKLSLAARWFVPEKEAKVILEDYQELLKGVEESQARERFGSPWKAVKEVINPREAVGWHFVLVAVLACLLFSVHWVRCFTLYSVAALVLAGVAVWLLLDWFGRERGKNPFKNQPKPLLILFFGGTIFLIALCGPIFFLPRCFISPYKLDETGFITAFLRWCVYISAGFGVVGLLLARMSGRGWRVLTILMFAVACISIYDLSLLQIMLPSFNAADYLFMSSKECIFIAAAGILASVAGMQ